MPVDGTSRGAWGLFRLWAGWVLGPVAWALHLVGSYLLVGWVCSSGGYWALHALTLATLALALLGALLSWRGRTADGAPGRFISTGGVVVALASGLVVVVEGIPNFILDACL